MSDYLDPLAFPFTVAELRVAVSFLASEAGEEELFQAVLDACAGVGSENARAAEARLQGSKDLADINDAVLMIPDAKEATVLDEWSSLRTRVAAMRHKIRIERPRTYRNVAAGSAMRYAARRRRAGARRPSRRILFDALPQSAAGVRTRVRPQRDRGAVSAHGP